VIILPAIAVFVLRGHKTGAAETSNVNPIASSFACVPLEFAQHSGKFNARPPSDVSLYFDCISAPVWRMVAITLSSEM